VAAVSEVRQRSGVCAGVVCTIAPAPIPELELGLRLALTAWSRDAESSCAGATFRKTAISVSAESVFIIHLRLAIKPPAPDDRIGGHENSVIHVWKSDSVDE
jgi:hypothetical protein